MSYGQKIKNYRENMGIKAKWVAEKINVPTSTLSFWESSEYPSLEGIIKLCAFYKIPLSEFFREEGSENYVPLEYLELVKSLLKLPEEKRITVLENLKGLVRVMMEK